MAFQTGLLDLGIDFQNIVKIEMYIYWKERTFGHIFSMEKQHMYRVCDILKRFCNQPIIAIITFFTIKLVIIM